MKFARLVWANIFRNKRRTFLTTASVAVAMFLFASLRSIITTLEASAELGSEARLITRNAIGITFPLPEAYTSRLESTRGIRSVSWANWFGGVYQDPQDFFAQFAVQGESYFAMYPEIHVPDDQLDAFLRERTAAIVGAGLMERFGWSLDQTVTLQGTIFPGDWEFTIRGVYTPENPSFSDQAMYFRYDYLFERTNRQVTPGWFVLQLEDPTAAADISTTIDALFENSTAPTATETERAFQAGFVTMWGNVAGLVRAIGTAVFFAILLVAANTMMMAARERINEVAVMKTLGFQNRTLATLVLAEATIITGVGGLIGLFLAKGFINPANPVNVMLPGFNLTTGTFVAGVGISIALGLVSGAVPAWQSARLSVVQALRRVA